MSDRGGPFMHNINLGSVQVHKRVIAEIVYSALQDLEGVKLASPGVGGKLKEFFGKPDLSAAEVHLNDSHEVSIEVKVIVRYGINIPDIARQIQDTLKQVIERTTDIIVKEINVNIQGVERGQK